MKGVVEVGNVHRCGCAWFMVYGSSAVHATRDEMLCTIMVSCTFTRVFRVKSRLCVARCSEIQNLEIMIESAAGDIVIATQPGEIRRSCAQHCPFSFSLHHHHHHLL